jgi:hypothetical protein
MNDLYEKKREKDMNELNLYKKILNKIHIKIREISRRYTDQQFCWYPIPETILGYTTYDSGNCIAYVMNELINNGFQVQYYHPHLLLIVWAFYVPEYIRENFKKKTGYRVNEKGQLLEDNENSHIDVEHLSTIENPFTSVRLQWATRHSVCHQECRPQGQPDRTS